MAQTQLQKQIHVASPNNATSNGSNPYLPTSLYVGDLDPSVNDSQLYDLFSQLGQVVSVRVCRDLTTRRSLGYGYVNYNISHDASRALEQLNFAPLNGKPIRIMVSRRDPSVRKSGTANIFIKNLDKTIDHKSLLDTFCTFGNILSCKVAMDGTGQSKGYGFVQFETEESAEEAIDKLNGMLLNDKQVFVGPFLRKQERDSSQEKTKFNNVYVKNLSETTTEEDLRNMFGAYGNITSAVVMRKDDGESRCFGFVNFENAEEASLAVDCLNGTTVDDKEWYVGKAQKKAEREIELKERFEQSVKETEEKFQGMNLYIKNLDDTIDDDKLRDLFSPFGEIASSKVMRDVNGISRGSGFVAFSAVEEAAKALSDMNGKMIVNKPLYVAIAQRKEERKARLMAHFSQPRTVTVSPPVLGARMYQAGGGGPPPVAAQQVFYGQAPAAMIPAQAAAGFGYHQLMRPPQPGPMANFFMPVVSQHRGGGRRGQHVMQQQQPPMMPRAGRVYRHQAGGRGYEMGPPPPLPPPPQPIYALASALANSTPEQQRTMLGETLYPLVDQLEHDNAAKVTGMLLEMDQPEVLHLLESPDALRAKVAEAIDVLRTVSAPRLVPTDQLSSLSLEENLLS